MLYTAYAIQTYGLALTTPSKNAFLTAVYCVLVPFRKDSVRAPPIQAYSPAKANWNAVSR